MFAGQPHHAIARRLIWGWERIEISDNEFYVALDPGMQPFSEIVLRIVPGSSSGSERLLLTRDPRSKSKARGLDQTTLETMVARAVRLILKRGDASIYQICEALICGLDAERFGEDVSVDILAALGQRFWHYSTPVAGGLSVTKWTMDKERADGINAKTAHASDSTESETRPVPDEKIGQETKSVPCGGCEDRS